MSPSKDDPAPAAPAKIAIKGFSLPSKTKTPSSSSSKTVAKPSLSSSLGKRSRSTFLGRDGEDSDSDEGHGRGAKGTVKVETVTGFEDGGTIRHDERGGKEGDGPLVIPKLENRDWKGDARAWHGRGKNLLPPEVQAAQEAARREREGLGREGEKKEGVDVVNSQDGEISWGLSVRKRFKVADADVDKVEAQKGQIEVIKEEVEEKPKSADEEALAALLGQEKFKKGPDLIISSTTTDEPPLQQNISETDAYRQAIASAPDVSTLEDYERVPVEEFGAALLRGMGWKGEKNGKVKEVKRRQNLLGLGAKELKEAEELGAWVHKSDVKRLNPGGGDRRGERKPKASEYRREEERRREMREEKGGGSYRREKEKEKERERERDGYRDRDRDSGRERDRRR